MRFETADKEKATRLRGLNFILEFWGSSHHHGLACSAVQSPRWMYCLILRRSYRCFCGLSGRSAVCRNGFLLVRITSLITSNDFVIVRSFLKNDKAGMMPNDEGDYER
jgi:hypothetical protein